MTRLNVKYASIFSFILSSNVVAGCGSTQTVDSKNVPIKAPEPTKTEVANPELGTTFPAEAKSTLMAQFRVRGSRGDTVRLTQNSQITVNGSAMSKIDGDAVNVATTLLNHLTLIPIFSLFRTGTFYTHSVPGPMADFVFTDDFNNSVKTKVAAPLATANFAKHTLNAKNPQVPYKIVLSVAETNDSKNAILDSECSLVSKWSELSSETQKMEEKSEHSTVNGTRLGAKFECTFPVYELLKHAKAQGGLELQAEIRQEISVKDEFFRTKEIQASTIFKERS
jgi:hypothetical protein